MASIFDMFTDPLGYKGINKQRKAGDEFARKMYNPNVYNPMVEEARRTSTEGVDDASMRTNYLRRLFANQPQRQAAQFGGNQAAMLSGGLAMNASLAGAQAGAELDIQSQEEAAKRQGRASLAELFSKQKQTQATQEAAIEQNKMVAQGEKNRRMNEAIGSAVGFGMDVLTGGTDTLAAKGIMSMFGGKGGAEVAGGEAVGDITGVGVGDSTTILERQQEAYKPDFSFSMLDQLNFENVTSDKVKQTKSTNLDNIETPALVDINEEDVFSKFKRVFKLTDDQWRETINSLETSGMEVGKIPVYLQNVIDSRGKETQTPVVEPISLDNTQQIDLGVTGNLGKGIGNTFRGVGEGITQNTGGMSFLPAGMTVGQVGTARQKAQGDSAYLQRLIELFGVGFNQGINK